VAKIRGSHQHEALPVIRLLTPDVTCQMTGDSPLDHFYKTGRIYSLRIIKRQEFRHEEILSHDYINNLDKLLVVSPNGESYYKNYIKNDFFVRREETKTCQWCLFDNKSHSLTTRHKITMTEKEGQSFCPNCLYGDEKISVNKNKISFRPKFGKFLECLNTPASEKFIAKKLGETTEDVRFWFYKTGLDRIYGTSRIAPPGCIKNIINKNDNSKLFFS
jgi:hypothetical protein